MTGWLAVALLAVSWLWAEHYFTPAHGGWYWAALAGAIGCLALGGGNTRRSLFTSKSEKKAPFSSDPLAGTAEGEGSADPSASDGLFGRWCSGSFRVGTVIFLLVAGWWCAWPEKMGPLAMLVGWVGLWLADSWSGVGLTTRRLSRAALGIGMILVAQGLALEIYTSATARNHDLPGWLRAVAGGLAKWVDSEAALSGNDVVFRVLGRLHRIGLCWEWFLDPTTVLFFVGGAVWLAWRCLESVPPGRRWPTWLAGFRRLAGVVGLWIPVRWMVALALYLQRASLEGTVGELLAVAQFFSPWTALLFLMGPVFLAGRLLKDFPIIKRDHVGTDSEERTTRQQTVCTDKEFSLAAGAVSARRMAAALAWTAVGAMLLALAAGWTPIGRSKPGRILVVERHSQWEPTLRAYDTTWYGEPSGYNYRLIYDYCSHFFQMGRILESEPITLERLEQGDVLIIKTPTAPYLPEEIEAIHRFVERGGGLLLIGDHTNVFRSSTYLNAIIRPMGFTFRNDLLFCIGSPYEQAYCRPWMVHPAVQHVGEMNFAVSCSVDPGRRWGWAAIRSTGLWSLPAAYEASNYHPHAEYRPYLRAGAFVQLWATSYGRGRVLAFTDSTIFSNFCIFQPGKAELFLNMLQWLNRTSLLDPWPIQAAITWTLTLTGLALVGLGCWKAFPPGRPESVSARDSVFSLSRSQKEKTSAHCPAEEDVLPPDGGLAKAILLLAGAMAAVTTTGALWGAYCRWAMPPMQPHTSYRLAVIDRTVSQVPLANGAFNQSPDGFGLLEHTIPRLGFFTARRQGRSVFDGDVLVVIAPHRSVPDWYREELIGYVAEGGKLLVVDHPDNLQSTANRLLQPFGLQIHHETLAPAGPLVVGDRSTGISVESACVVSGGEALVHLGRQPVAARTSYGKGRVAAIGFGQVWTDQQMHSEWRANWMPEPTAMMRARYELFYSLFQALAEGGTIQWSKPSATASPPPEAPKVPEAHQVPEAPLVPEKPIVPEKGQKSSASPPAAALPRSTPPKAERPETPKPTSPSTVPPSEIPEAPMELEKSPPALPSEKTGAQRPTSPPAVPPKTRP